MKWLSKILLKTLSYGLLAATMLGIGLGLYAVKLLPELPTIEQIRRAPLDRPLRIYNRDNQLIAEYGNERRTPITLDKIPPLLIDAVLAAEDARFYHHSGVDFLGILRAGWSNLLSKSRAQGASTITMQVARNFFLTPEKTYVRKFKEILLAFSMERALTKDEILELYLNKIFLGHRAYGFAVASQVYYGTALENLSVPEITMLAGLPKAPSRNNPISNPQRALERRDYVLKRLRELGKIDELSYHTARQAPITAKPRLTGVKEQAPYVAELVRQWMVERFGEAVYELGYRVDVTIRGEYQAHAEQALRKGLLDYDQRHGFRGALAHVNLEEHSPQSLTPVLRQFPSSRELQPAVVLQSGARSLTALTQEQRTIHIDWEHIRWAKTYETPNRTAPPPTTAAEVVGRGDIIYVAPLRAADTNANTNTNADIETSGWRLAQMPQVSGALVSLDPNSGAILALTGGFDYYLSKFNRATQALRQPGSNIKPFIYSAALAHGFTPSSLVSAAPIVTVDGLEGVWRPQNYSKKFFGPTRLRRALSLSLNLVSVRLLRAIGIDTTIAHLEKFGFDAEQLPRNLTLALGSIDITPLDLASKFAVFANGGKRVTPYLIARITDGEGNPVALPAELCVACPAQDARAQAQPEPVWQAPPHAILRAAEDEPEAEADPKRAISEQNAFLLSSMLQQVILSGTGRRAQALKRSDLSGKTGTTNNYQDAWFSGFNQDVVTTVFVGFDQPAHLGNRESGAGAALPIWIDYMRVVLKDFPERPRTPPPNITHEFINKNTGKLTTADDADRYLEYYLIGTEPNHRAPRRQDKQADSETLF